MMQMNLLLLLFLYIVCVWITMMGIILEDVPVKTYSFNWERSRVYDTTPLPVVLPKQPGVLLKTYCREKKAA